MSDTAHENHGSEAEAVEPRQGLLQRIGRLGKLASEKRLAMGLAGVGLLILATGICVAVAIWGGPAEPASLEKALAALDAGRYPEARQMGERLIGAKCLPADSRGGPQFVIGAALAYEADHLAAKARKSDYLLSSRYLEEARRLGFPPDRRGEGLFLLGKALYASGQLPASRLVLRETLKAAPQHRAETLSLLAEAYLAGPEPDYQEALAVNDIYLADRAMPLAARRGGLLQRARILLGLRQKDQCLATLEQIPEEAPEQAEAIVIRAEILMAEADDLLSGDEVDSDRRANGIEKYDAAIALLEDARGRDALSVQTGRKAMHLVGLCLLRKADFNRALEQLAMTSRACRGSAEALAADFEMAELHQGLGQHKEAIRAYQRALAAAGDPDGYKNPWISFAELKRRAVSAYEAYLRQQSFDRALLLAEALARLVGPASTAEMIARAHAEWGRQMLATESPEDDLLQQQSLGREHLRRAGNAYAALARMRIATDRYADDLWRSAQCCLQGRDYLGATHALQEFLKNGPRQRHAQALADLGEAQLNLGRTGAALESLQECIDVYPRDASAYRARLIASRAHVERDEMQQAEAMLNANLNGHLTPDSIEWRSSLFALGNLLHRQRRYQEAAERFNEAVRRYPEDPDALNARYLLAECHRAEANRLHQQLETDLVESVRRANLRKASDCLTSAIEGYSFVRQALNERQEQQHLNGIERKTLRNCYFAIGACWFRLGDYEEAVRAYTAAGTRYQGDPEALDAYVQIARAHRRLSDPDEARAALRRGGEILKRLKHRPEFLQATNFNAQEWETMLDWLKTL